MGRQELSLPLDMYVFRQLSLIAHLLRRWLFLRDMKNALELDW
jgi:hypothetical protein